MSDDARAEAVVPAHCGNLPRWQIAELPEPLPFSLRNVLRTIGPGAILLAGAIGGGEWIAGPIMVINYGYGILWIATVAIGLQVFFNLEAVRYTLYTGEPILWGIMRLRPSARFWGTCYTILAIGQLGVPSLASGCAAVVLAAALGDLPRDEHKWIVKLLTIVIVVFSAGLLLSGKTVERVLEKVSWIMIILIFSFLVFINIACIPLQTSAETLWGFFHFGFWPEQMDLGLFAVFAATAGSGGVGNLVISNWFRDKGFAMGVHAGSIGGLRARQKTLSPVGSVFVADSNALSRWRRWLRYVWIDQWILWAGGCFLGMYLNVNLARAVIPPGTQLEGIAAGAFQAKYLAESVAPLLWWLALLNGFWILFSTHLSNTDGLVRFVCDISWISFPQLQLRTASRVYAALLGLFTVWAVVSANWGTALELFKILGFVASPIMALGAWQIWRVNRSFLPARLRPAWWQEAGLLGCGIFYAVVTIAVIASGVASIWRNA